MNRTMLGSAMTALFALTAAAGTAGAQDGARALAMDAVNLTAAAEAEAGTPRPESARVELPGDVLEYRLVFTNTTDGEVQNVAFSNPLPNGLIYVADTAGADRDDVRVEFSIDGGQDWSARPEIELPDENGQMVRQPAPTTMYTDVRWTLTGGVAPGATVRARYHTLVATAARP